MVFYLYSCFIIRSILLGKKPELYISWTGGIRPLVSIYCMSTSDISSHFDNVLLDLNHKQQCFRIITYIFSHIKKTRLNRVPYTDRIIINLNELSRIRCFYISRFRL